MVTGLIAAVRLGRVESAELQRRSSRVRSAITDSVTIAKVVIVEAKRGNDLAISDARGHFIFHE